MRDSKRNASASFAVALPRKAVASVRRLDALADRSGRASGATLRTLSQPGRNWLLAEREQEPIERLTPHTLRRTFASILALCEVRPRRARQLMGHEDSRTTADIHEHDLDDSDHAIELRESVLGCDLAESHDVFAKRRVSGAKPARDAKPAEAGFEALLEE